MSVRIEDVSPETEYFACTCGHINESEEIDACGRRRAAWFRRACERGASIKVLFVDGRPRGTAFVLPIEFCPWGPLGRDLMVLPCLFLKDDVKRRGHGRALLAAAEEETQRRGRKALVTYGYYWDCWFMQASFFEHCGWDVVDRRGEEAMLWKRFAPNAEPPRWLQPRYRHEPVAGAVTVDLFWNTFCQTSCIEARRVREVCAEFGDAVVLRDHCVDEAEVLRTYQIPRAIYVDGRTIGWGYEAPRDGIRRAIEKALADRPD